MPKSFRCLFLVLMMCAALAFSAASADTISVTPRYKALKTKYTSVFYPDDNTLCIFLSKVSNQKCRFDEKMDLIEADIDKVVELVEKILDMAPRNFRINIELKPGDDAASALYMHQNKTITVSADKVTYSSLSHEVARAVVANYFITAPAASVQEIFAQYVDKHLWEYY
jgi:hypothetical protein